MNYIEWRYSYTMNSWLLKKYIPMRALQYIISPYSFE